MANANLKGRLDAGNSNVQFDAWNSASAQPRRDSLRHRTILAICAVCGIGSAFAATTTTVSWQAVSGVLDGDFTNAAHWAGGAVPGALQRAYPNATGTYTISFPKGEYASLASIRQGVANGHTVTWDGEGSRFHAALPTASNYNGEPFGFISTGGNHLFNLEYSGSSVKSGTGLGATDWIPPYGFENFRTRLIGRKNVSELHFDTGTFNFYDPLGTCYYGNLPRVVFFYNAVNNGNGDWEEIVFHPGTVSRLPNIQCRAKSCKTRLTYAGGEHLVFGSFLCPSGEGGSGLPWYVTDISVTNSAQLTVNSGIYLGDSGVRSTNRTINVTVSDGGRITTSGIDHKYATVNFTIGSGGTLDSSLSLAMYASATATVSLLTGGTLIAKKIVGQTTTSEAHFLARGGTLRAKEASTKFFCNFAEAALGAEGLTLDSDYDLTIPQNFMNAADVTSGTPEAGLLVKTGDGTLTMTGTDSTFGAFEVRRGNLVLPAGAKVRTALTMKNGCRATLAADNGLTALTLGDAHTTGELVLKPDTTIAIGGPVSLPNGKLALSGSFTQGQTYTVLTARGDCSAARTAWTKLLVGTGYVEGQKYILTSDEQDGTTSFKLTVDVAETHSKNVTADETAAAPVTHSQYDTYDVTVADDATYTIPTSLTTGLLVKKGLGELNVAADLLNLYLGVELRDGTLAFTNVSSAAAAELSVPLRVNKTDAGVTIVRTDADVTLTDMAVTAGAWIKHGTGTLTVLNEGAQTKALTKSNGSVSAEGSLGGGVIRLQPGKAPPASGFSGASVAEGTLHLKGTGTSSVFNLQNSVAVGLVTPDVHEDAQPRLVVDNCLVNTCGPSYHFLFAANMMGANVSQYAGHSPEIVVTNKGVITLDALTTVKNGDSGAIGRPKVTVDDATFFSSYRIYGNLVNSAGMVPTFTIRNKGRFIEKYSTSYPNSARIDAGLYCAGPAVFVVDDALLATAASATSTSYDGVGLYVGGSTADVSFTVTNNAVFWCRYVSTGSSLKRLRFTFDKATWEFGSGTNLCVENTAATTVDVRTGGLTVHAKTAQPLRINQPFTGAGTLTKTGSATLWFDARAQWTSGKITPYAADSVTLACDVSVQEGTLAVSPGAASGTNVITLAASSSLDLRAAAVDNLVLAGAGTVANGTLVAPVFRVDPAGTEPVVTLAADAAVSGAAEVDVGAALPPPYPQALVVAHYAGTAPSVASWKIARHPGSPRLRGAFTAANGNVSVKITHPSTLISVR